MRDPRIKADEATIAKSLQGHWREEHIFELTQALELYRFYQDKIAECDREIEAQLERFEDHSNGDPPAAKSGRRRSKGNVPRFDVWTHLYRMTGVDLTQIDGVDAYTALKVVSEIGTDMTKWTSAKHFASWLGLSPNNRITGGKLDFPHFKRRKQANLQVGGTGRPEVPAYRGWLLDFVQKLEKLSGQGMLDQITTRGQACLPCPQSL